MNTMKQAPVSAAQFSQSINQSIQLTKDESIYFSATISTKCGQIHTAPHLGLLSVRFEYLIFRAAIWHKKQQ